MRFKEEGYRRDYLPVVAFSGVMRLDPHHVVERFARERVSHIRHRALDLPVEVARIANPSGSVEVAPTADEAQHAGTGRQIVGVRNRQMRYGRLRHVLPRFTSRDRSSLILIMARLTNSLISDGG